MTKEKINEIITQVIEFLNSDNPKKDISGYLGDELYNCLDDNCVGAVAPLHHDANALCNRLDLEMSNLTSKVKNCGCITNIKIGEKVDIFSKMYDINESYKLISNARDILFELEN